MEVDEKTARALESRAETQKLQVEFKLMNSLGDCPAAKEWKELIAEEILMEKKKKMVVIVFKILCYDGVTLLSHDNLDLTLLSHNY